MKILAGGSRSSIKYYLSSLYLNWTFVFIFSDYRLACYAYTVFGACLGVRYKDAKWVQLYYICPVTCIISSPAARPTGLAGRVTQEIVAESMEIAIEYGSYLSSKTPEYI